MEGFFGVIFMSVVSIFLHVLLLKYPKMINEYMKLKMLIVSSGRLLLLLVVL